MYGFSDMPPIDGGELDRLIDERVEHNEYLFFRRNPGDDLDPFLGREDGYECFCTKCREHFVKPLKSGPASRWDTCPVCNSKVFAKRWGKENARFLAAEAFLFSFFHRGRGREVWLVSVQVRMNPRFTESKYCAREMSRIVFFDGGAKRWKYDYYGRVHPVKRITLPTWVCGIYNRFPSYTAADMDVLRDSCLEYCCLETVNYRLDNLAAYLALYCRYPAAVEHLVKRGFVHWLRERERGSSDFHRVVNLRADNPKKLFRGLDRADLRALSGVTLRTALFYRELKKAGAAHPDETSVDFTKSAAAFLDFPTFSSLCGAFRESPKAVRKYIERQARRADQSTNAALVELRDYRDQLDRLGLGDCQLPSDLHEAHMRLTRRETRLANHEQNTMFRARRHLLRWMCWKHGGYFIRPVDSVNEITLEGEAQSNCVARYAARHANGKTIIMLLRQCSAPGTSWHTVEIDPETLECLQCYGFRNRTRTPEAAKFMEDYLHRLREVARMNGRKLM